MGARAKMTEALILISCLLEDDKRMIEVNYKISTAPAASGLSYCYGHSTGLGISVQPPNKSGQNLRKWVNNGKSKNQEMRDYAWSLELSILDLVTARRMQ